MGVNGLLQVLKEIQDPCSLERYRDQTLAIDAYGWLHRGIISCAKDLCLNNPTRSYIQCILNKIQMLRHFNITPYFVFDGQSLPMKQDTENQRKDRRNEARVLAEKLHNENKHSLAYKQFMKAAYVTSKMAKSVMCELDLLGIKYVVAPYEADPQMVYLEKIGVVDGILSEDSDLLIFGCKKLITKLKDNGTCVEIDRSNFPKVKSIPYLDQYSSEQMRLVAMISGCDYTKGIPKIGLKTAFQLVRKYNHLEKVLIALRSMGKYNGSEDVKIEFHNANLAFQFQKVFDPRTQKLTSLCETDIDEEMLELCCGKRLTNELYVEICNGKINPRNHEVLITREQNLNLLKSKSVNEIKVFESVAVRSNSESIVDLLKRKRPVEKEPIKRTKIEKRMENFKGQTGGVSRFFKSTVTPDDPTDDDEVEETEEPCEEKFSQEFNLDDSELDESPVKSLRDKFAYPLREKSVNIEQKYPRIDIKQFAFRG